MSDEWTNGTQTSIHPARHDDGLPPLTLAAGLVAALIGGAVWAAIAIFGNLEVGWVAWGIGAAVGGAMALTTPARSRKLAVVAAMLALVGLAAGKAMTFAGSAGPIAEEIMEEDGYMQGMTAWQMYAEGALSPDLQTAVADTEARGDTLTDALWADMLEEAEGRLAAMSEEDRRALARETAGGMIRQMGIVEGMKAQLSGFDFLWIALALATAFRIMDAVKPEPVVAEAEARGSRENQPV